MNAASLLRDLNAYRDLWWTRYANRFEEERETLSRFQALYQEFPACLYRKSTGHLTASALVLDPKNERKILFTHHRKLDLWLQLGGHCDGDADVAGVALREGQEESGLTQLLPAFSGQVIDMDIHRIPARPGEPAHEHYDLRYVFFADSSLPLLISEESKDLRWFGVKESYQVTSEASLRRLIAKSEFLLEKIGSGG